MPAICHLPFASPLPLQHGLQYNPTLPNVQRDFQSDWCIRNLHESDLRRPKCSTCPTLFFLPRHLLESMRRARHVKTHLLSCSDLLVPEYRRGPIPLVEIFCFFFSSLVYPHRCGPSTPPPMPLTLQGFWVPVDLSLGYGGLWWQCVVFFWFLHFSVDFYSLLISILFNFIVISDYYWYRFSILTCRF
jgi:hypothetical protein